MSLSILISPRHLDLAGHPYDIGGSPFRTRFELQSTMSRKSVGWEWSMLWQLGKLDTITRWCEREIVRLPELFRASSRPGTAAPLCQLLLLCKDLGGSKGSAGPAGSTDDECVAQPKTREATISRNWRERTSLPTVSALVLFQIHKWRDSRDT